MKRTRDDFWLSRVANQIAAELRAQSGGTRLRIRAPRRIHETDTGGWSAVIGSLGQGQPGLEIWLDRFSGHPERKFYACFYSRNEKAIRALAFRSESLWPIREVTDDDMVEDSFSRLKKRLMRREFNAPVLEDYRERGHHFFGFYDVTGESAQKTETRFCGQAVDFFLDVARSLPKARAEDVADVVYPRCENRKWVAGHLARERSRFLATQCKERDKFRCQVCAMTFADEYGQALGKRFAEAHHKKPLGRLSDKVKTRLEDLITVCANCHRMLHRMDGKPGDVTKLTSIVRKNRRTLKP